MKGHFATSGLITIAIHSSVLCKQQTNLIIQTEIYLV